MVTIITAGPEGIEISNIKGNNIPSKQLKVENNILYPIKLLIFLDIFLAEAAGIKSNASTKEAPIIFTDATVTIVIISINT